MCKLGVISQELLKLLLSANTHICRVDWHNNMHMTLSDLEWPFHALRAISAVAEFLVYTTTSFLDKFVVVTSASEVIQSLEA